MQHKTIKFRDVLAKKILVGEKDVTWRLYDDKDFKEGDEVDLINWESGEKFGEVLLTSVREKKMGELLPSDFEGHEAYESEEAMYEHFRTYYGDKVGPDTLVKIIKFKLT